MLYFIIYIILVLEMFNKTAYKEIAVNDKKKIISVNLKLETIEEYKKMIEELSIVLFKGKNDNN